MTPPSGARSLRSDAGATLIEVLVALSILSVAGLAILAGVQGGILTSDIQRKQSVGGANVRNYAEAVQDWVAEGNYDPCAGGVDYRPSTDSGNAAGSGPVPFVVPPGYDAGYDAGLGSSSRSVVPLGGDGSELACAADEGVQRVRFTMRSEDGRASEELVVILRDPCATDGAPGC